MKNVIFQHLDPLLRDKMRDGHENSTKTKSSDTYSSKMLYTPSALYFLASK